MQEIIHRAMIELDELKKESMNQSYIVTSEVRKISRQLYKTLEDHSIDYVLDLCEQLLEQRSWALGVIAYDWAYRVRKQYRENTFTIFEQWLIKYIRGWGDCDDFCTHAFGELLSQYTHLIPRVMEWTKREEFYVRRAAAVILIPSIKAGKYQEVMPFQIADLLMYDQEDLVCKGYGWMLKMLSQQEEDLVFDYLRDNRDKMPRVAFRYALEKMDQEKRLILMER